MTNSFHNQLRGFVKSQIFSGTVYVTVGMFIGSVFAYLLQIFLARSLSVTDFGVFTALLSVSFVVGVVSTALLTSLVKVVSDLSSKRKNRELTSLFVSLSAGLIVWLVVFAAAPFIANFLVMDGVSVFLMFGFFVGVTILSVIPSGYLQGLLKFKQYAIFSIITPAIRLLLPIVAISAGFGVSGVFGGMGLAVVTSYFLALYFIRNNLTSYKKMDLKPIYKKLLTFSGAVLFVQVGMTLLNNVDVILVKHYFDGVTAGLYSGLVTVGKVLLFGASTVGAVMFPLVSSAYSSGKSYFKAFRPLLIIQSGVTAVGIVFFALFPRFITTIMFGQKYLAVVEYLPRFAFFVGMYVLINFFILFFLAIEKMVIPLILLPAILAQIAAIVLFHDSIFTIINVNLAVSASLLLGVVLYYIKNVHISNSTRI